uniref:Uncharacterized protein n=1 Tax=Strigamia maritima TaxID=126957 RepID=T1IJA6_STRMM
MLGLENLVNSSALLPVMEKYGIFKRCARLMKVGEVGKLQLYGRHYCDIFSQPHYLINNVDIRVSLTKNSDTFSLISLEANADYKTTINDAGLVINKIVPSASVLLAHHQALEKRNAKYPIQRVKLKHLLSLRDLRMHL